MKKINWKRFWLSILNIIIVMQGALGIVIFLGVFLWSREDSLVYLFLVKYHQILIPTLIFNWGIRILIFTICNYNDIAKELGIKDRFWVKQGVFMFEALTVATIQIPLFWQIVLVFVYFYTSKKIAEVIYKKVILKRTS